MTRFKKFFTLDNPKFWVLNPHIGNYNTNIQLTRNFSHSVYVKLCIVKYLIGLELWVLMVLGVQSADLSVNSLLAAPTAIFLSGLPPSPPPKKGV